MDTTTTNDAGRVELDDVPSRVAPLSELDDYEVADGQPEVRGWSVRDSAGRAIGYVYDLIIDVAALRVLYLDVELDAGLAGNDADRRALVPVDSVDIDRGSEEILLRGVTAAEVRTLVPYALRGVPRGRAGGTIVTPAPVATPADVASPAVKTEVGPGRAEIRGAAPVAGVDGPSAPSERRV